MAALVVAGCVAAGAIAQTSPAATAPAAQSAAGAAAPASDANIAFLTKASQLYYSTSKAGLKSFDCAVHPEWRTLFLSAAPAGTPVADDDAKILLLKTVAITLHGRLGGGSSLDWNVPSDPAKPIDAESKTALDGVHKGAEQTLIGFMQFWTPFVDGSVIPSSADGIDFTRSDKGVTLHADQGGTSLTEVLGSDMVLQQFNVVTGGAKINFSPRYKPTDQGLLVNAFLAHIQPPSTPADQGVEMHVEIEYQTVSSFPIPSEINVEVVGQGKFNFALDGCTVNAK
jgi:hypothetical protein